MKLADLLRPDARASSKAVDVSLVDAAIADGVAPLLYSAMRDRGELEAIDPRARERLVRAAREAALVEEVRGRDLRDVVSALAAEGVRPLLFKGAALAVTHYPEPWLRSRGDSDLLLTAEEAPRAARLLESRGFVRVPRPGGDLVTQQMRYQGRLGDVAIAYDVHWRVADPHAFREALPFGELERCAVNDHPSGARRIGNVHALAVACVHRAAHHYDAPTLILLYDIYLLIARFTATDWQEFTAWAEEKRQCAVALRALELAADAFDCRVPPGIRSRLANPALTEPTARFVAAAVTGRPLRRIDLLLSDLAALRSWRTRLALLRQHLFPERDYVGASGQPALAAPRYLGRIVRGAASWFRPL